eukprot:scaffold4554_cov178-Amphora_coffeaeformis.AAC.8
MGGCRDACRCSTCPLARGAKQSTAFVHCSENISAKRIGALFPSIPVFLDIILLVILPIAMFCEVGCTASHDHGFKMDGHERRWLVVVCADGSQHL